jgi:WD40 repeat protein/tetratricopeptide (TPR) repeat protein
MDTIQEKLQPLIDLLPEKVRDYWWAVFGLAAIFLVLIVFALFRGIIRGLFGKRKAPQEDWDRKLRQDLTSYPPPPGTPGKQRLTIYHVPARLRLVVMSEILSNEDDGSPLTVARQINQLCDRFEAEWQAGAEPIVENYIADAAEPARHELVRELLKLDIHYRRERGDTLVPRDYVARFPEHVSLIDTLLGAALLQESPTDLMQAGRYGLEDEIGVGGMGKVFRAHDPDFCRSLAVKVLKEEYKDRPDLVARFLEEAQITGQLQHPGVPPVHEIGRLADGRPFLAMKLIEGRTLKVLLAERRDPAHDLPRYLTIFEQVCQTLGYAHARNVIHRDLKPENVMVGAFGEVQVMDWGLAKVLTAANKRHESSDSLAANAPNTPRPDTVVGPTERGVVLGTLAFMPAEQARGEIDRVDERSDVFGLGAILCVLLTGQPPYRECSQEKLWEQAKNADLADAFARLDSCRADAELATLAKRCLAKNQDERPRGAAAVAEAVAVYQASVRERLRRAEMERAAAEVKAREERKRRRQAVAAGSLVVLVVVGGLLATYWQYRKTVEEKNRSTNLATNLKVQLQKTQEGEAGLALHHGLDLSAKGDDRPGLVLLAHALDLATKAEAAPLQRAIRAHLAVQWAQVPALKAVLPHQGAVVSLAFSSDGTQFVTGDMHGTAQVWETTTGKPVGNPIHDPSFKGITVAFSPYSRAILTGTGSPESLWDWSRLMGERFHGMPRLPGLEGLGLAGLGEEELGWALPPLLSFGVARLWDTGTGKLLRTFDWASNDLATSFRAVRGFAFSPDGRTLLTASEHITKDWRRSGPPELIVRPKPVLVGVIQFWDAATGKLLHSPIRLGDPVLAAAFSPSSKWAATGGADGIARIWDVDTGKSVGPPLEHEGPIVAMAFSPDSRKILTASRATSNRGTVRLWDLATGAPLGQPLATSGLVSAVAVSPDGRTILTGGGEDTLSNNGEANLWDEGTGRPLTSSLPHQGFVYAVAYSPDGRHMVTASADRAARIWEATIGMPLVLLQSYHNAAACRPDGQALLRALPDHKAQLCEAATGKLLASAFPNPALPIHRADPHSSGPRIGGPPLFSPDGQYLLLFGSTSEDFQVCEAATGKPIGQALHPCGSVGTIVFSPDGQLILTVGTGPGGIAAQIWETVSGKLLIERSFEAKGTTRSIRATAFSPDGPLAVTGGDGQSAQVWDITKGDTIGQPLSHGAPIHAVAFSPDARTVVTGSDDTTARLWETATGKPVSDPLTHNGKVRYVTFSPDGSTVVTCSDDHTAHLWNAATGEAIGQALPLRDSANVLAFSPVDALAFSPRGDMLATGSPDGAVRLWDATGRPISEVLQHAGRILDLVFSQDGRTLLVRTWERGGTGPFFAWDDSDSRIGQFWRHSCTVWGLPGPLQGDNDQITNWALVHTGLELNANGVISVLDKKNWLDRRKKLGNPRLVSEDTPPTWHEREAVAAERRGNWYAAAWHLERLVLTQPSQWPAHCRLGRAWSMLGAWDKALKETAQAIELGRDQWEPWHTQGVAHALQGQPQKALEDFSQAVKRGAKHWEPWYERGRVYAQMEQWHKAADDFTKATTLPQDLDGTNLQDVTPSPEAWADLALVRLELKDSTGYAEACYYLRNTYGKTADADLAALIAWVWALSDHLQQKVELEKRLVQQRVGGNLGGGRNLPFGMKSAAEISMHLVKLAQGATATRPGDYRTMRALGASLYRAGLFDAAIQTFDAAFTEPEQPAPAAGLFLAMAHHRLGHKEEAQRWLNKSKGWIEQARQTKSSKARTLGRPGPNYPGPNAWRWSCFSAKLRRWSAAKVNSKPWTAMLNQSVIPVSINVIRAPASLLRRIRWMAAHLSRIRRHRSAVVSLNQVVY